MNEMSHKKQLSPALEKWMSHLESNGIGEDSIITIRESILSNHLDEILGPLPNLGPIQVIRTSVDCFEIMIEHIQKRKFKGQPILGIPLKGDSQKIKFAAPDNFEDLVDQWRTEEPPSLYLRSWERSKKYFPAEEYRVPLSFNLVEKLSGKVYAYYWEGRSLIEIENDLEFGRGVNLEYYPEGQV